MDKEKIMELIEEAIKEIPTPPPGREAAMVKTKLDEAKLWLREVK